MVKLSDLPGEESDPSFILLAESINLHGLDHSVPLAGGARLLRAPPHMSVALSSLVQPHTMTLHMRRINPWGSEYVTKKGQTEIRQILDPTQHTYWIVQHWRRLFDTELEHALELAEPGFTPLMALRKPQQVTSGSINAHAILNWLEENLVATSRDLRPKDVTGIERAWKLLIDFEAQDEQSYPFIKTAISNFADLKRIPSHMPIYVVGLFSIIEMLLTTQQDKTTENSLSHQLKEKLTLFGNRFTDPLRLEEHLPLPAGTDFKKVIAKLYSYRSKVAHGTEVEFRGELSVLKNHETVCRFLRVIVRKLILQAVSEPALFRDLKSC